MPKVSIVVPVYNVEKYLEKSLDSLVNQTLQDIEIIVVNDGSTDNSKEIIKKYIQRYPGKIKYFEKDNGGLSDARNFGMMYANGEYIAFLDSDDYVEIDMYKKMYDRAKEDDYDMVECDFIWEYPKKIRIDTGSTYKNKKEMLAYGRVVAWNKLIKRELIQKTKNKYPKGLIYEDVEFFYKMLPYYDKVSAVREPLVHYIQRADSISNNQDARAGDIFRILDNVIDYYKRNCLYEEYKTELEYTYTRLLLCSSLLRILKIKNKNIRNQLIDKTWTNLNSVFPNWRYNEILNNIDSIKNIYLKCINRYTFKVICKIYGTLM